MSRRQWIILAGGAVLLAILVGLYLAGGKDAGEPSMAAVRTALTSIYFHTDPPGEPPDELEFLPLGKAAEILRADRTRRMAEVHRRRAIIQIVGAATLTPAGTIGPETHLAALRTLEAPVTEITERLRESPDLSREAKERMAEQVLLDLLGRVFPGCVEDYGNPGVWTDPSTHITQASIRYTVNRQVDNVAAVLDPQVWDECMAMFFPATYLTKLYKGKPVPDGDCGAEEGLGENTGSSYRGVLFERFEISGGRRNPNAEAWFTNLLEVVTTRSTGTWKAEYQFGRLGKPLCSRFQGEPTWLHGGIDVDNGYINATQKGDLTEVESLKNVKLSDRPSDIPRDMLDLMTRISLDMLCNEAPQATCCALTAP